MSGITAYIQGALCSVIDSVLDVAKGGTDLSFVDPVVIGRSAFKVTNDFVSGITAHVQELLCSVLDLLLDTVGGVLPEISLEPLKEVSETKDAVVAFMSSMFVSEQVEEKKEEVPPEKDLSFADVVEEPKEKQEDLTTVVEEEADMAPVEDEQKEDE